MTGGWGQSIGAWSSVVRRSMCHHLKVCSKNNHSIKQLHMQSPGFNPVPLPPPKIIHIISLKSYFSAQVQRKHHEAGDTNSLCFGLRTYIKDITFPMTSLYYWNPQFLSQLDTAPVTTYWAGSSHSSRTHSQVSVHSSTTNTTTRAGSVHCENEMK